MQLHDGGEHSPAELAELFGVGRSTVYRAVARARAASSTAGPNTSRAGAGRQAPVGGIALTSATVTP